MVCCVRARRFPPCGHPVCFPGIVAAASPGCGCGSPDWLGGSCCHRLARAPWRRPPRPRRETRVAAATRACSTDSQSAGVDVVPAKVKLGNVAAFAVIPASNLMSSSSVLLTLAAMWLPPMDRGPGRRPVSPSFLPLYPWGWGQEGVFPGRERIVSAPREANAGPQRSIRFVDERRARAQFRTPVCLSVRTSRPLVPVARTD